MSTYVYLTCLDHDPPLLADRESGQHLSDLPDIRRDIASREFIVAEADRLGGWYDRDYFGEASLLFMLAHRTCRLGITDEYGQRHDQETPR